MRLEWTLVFFSCSSLQGTEIKGAPWRSFNFQIAFRFLCSTFQAGFLWGEKLPRSIQLFLLLGEKRTSFVTLNFDFSTGNQILKPGVIDRKCILILETVWFIHLQHIVHLNDLSIFLLHFVGWTYAKGFLPPTSTQCPITCRAVCTVCACFCLSLGLLFQILTPTP